MDLQLLPRVFKHVILECMLIQQYHQIVVLHVHLLVVHNVKLYLKYNKIYSFISKINTIKIIINLIFL